MAALLAPTVHAPLPAAPTGCTLPAPPAAAREEDEGDGFTYDSDTGLDGEGHSAAQNGEMLAMNKAMVGCKVTKGGKGDVLCLMERCDGKPFVVHLSSGAKELTAKQILKSFCKQHVNRCPDDEWWANAKECSLWKVDEMKGDDDWELAPTARLDHGRTQPGPYLVRRRGQTTSFRALKDALESRREREYDATDAERIAATVRHFEKDAQKYMELRRNVLTGAEAGNAYYTRVAHFLARPRSLLFENLRGSSSKMRILDAGCGDGRDSVELACRGVQLCPEGCTVAVVGVDAAARNVEFAESNARQLRNRTGAPPPPFAF